MGKEKVIILENEFKMNMPNNLYGYVLETVKDINLNVGKPLFKRDIIELQGLIAVSKSISNYVFKYHDVGTVFTFGIELGRRLGKDGLIK